jgi:hypothetical protein
MIVVDESQILRWSKGSCGQSGCVHSTCVCAVCALPIGVADDDPRWETHDEYCGGCDLCEDDVPAMLFRGEGKNMEQAAFHNRCFAKIVRHVREEHP